MGYGPGNDLNLKKGYPWTYELEVPPNVTVKLSFSQDASWENALIIYSLPSLQKLVEKGNHGRSLTSTELPNNTTGSQKSYLITGWHKEGEPDGTKDWIQSRCKVIVADGRYFEIGFDDGCGVDEDYNDIACKISFEQ